MNPQHPQPKPNPIHKPKKHLAVVVKDSPPPSPSSTGMGRPTGAFRSLTSTPSTPTTPSTFRTTMDTEFARNSDGDGDGDGDVFDENRSERLSFDPRISSTDTCVGTYSDAGHGTGPGTGSGPSGPSPSSNNDTGTTQAQAQDQDQIHHTHTYPCLFHTLNCHETFTDTEQWKTHILSHFRTHPPPPPPTATCSLCPNETITIFSHNDSHSPPSPTSTASHRYRYKYNNKAWDLMLDHVITAYYQCQCQCHQGQSQSQSQPQPQPLVGTWSRPDFKLMQYLYRKRVIGEAEFKAVQLAPGPDPPAPPSGSESLAAAAAAAAQSRDSQSRSGLDGLRGRVGCVEEPFWEGYSRRRERRLMGRGGIR